MGAKRRKQHKGGTGPTRSRRPPAQRTDAAPMDAERWQRLEELFHRATALPRTERTAFLERAATDDPELVTELTGLLSAAGMSEGFVEEVMRRAVGDGNR